jgi:hypothetical protein
VVEEMPAYPKASVDGFGFTMFVSYDDCGGAWVKAQDGRIAGLVWETAPERRFETVAEPDSARWGTYAVAQPLPLTDDEEATRYWGALLPELRRRWAAADKS